MYIVDDDREDIKWGSTSKARGRGEYKYEQKLASVHLEL